MITLGACFVVLLVGLEVGGRHGRRVGFKEGHDRTVAWVLEHGSGMPEGWTPATGEVVFTQIRSGL